MLKEMIVLQTSSAFPSGAIGDLLNKWEESGFFSYLLPFLLIFALVFGILTKVNIFKDNKVVNGIIALAVSLMSLQFSFVPQFFSQIFPRLGVGLAIILAILILVGLFIDKNNNAINYVLLAIGVIVFGMVLIQSAGAVGWQSGQWWEDNWQTIIGALFLIILVVVIIGSSGGNKNSSAPTYKSVAFN
ncbi:Uncharacterised protein [uncultured archaeon]|nr:Uncharacterised protein [uncultured archaeon]